MHLFNEPNRLNRFIELYRTASIESTEMRQKRVRRQIDVAINGATKRKQHVRFNRAH